MRCLIPLLVVGALAGADAPATPLWSFAADEHWSAWWPADRGPSPVTVAAVDGGTLVTLRAGDKPVDVAVYAPAWKEERAIGDDPRVIAIAADLREGAEATLALRLMDGRKEGFALKPRTLKHGANALEWHPADDIASTWGPGGDRVLDAPVHLFELGVGCPAHATVAVLLRSATVRDRRAPAAAGLDRIAVDVDTGSPLHLLRPGHEADLALVVTDRDERPARVTLEARCTHADGPVVVFRTDLALAAGETRRWTPPATLAKRGPWRVDWTLTDAAGAHRSDSLPIAIVEPSGPVVDRPPRFLFGANGSTVGMGSGRDLELSILAAGTAGLRTLRSGVDWNAAQPTPGAWNQAVLDDYSRAIDAYAKAGVQQQFLLAFTAKWAAPEKLRGSATMTDWLFAPPELDAWRGYVAKMATTFGGRVRWWEVWNETDIVEFWPGTIDQYLEVLHVAHDAIKQVDPKLQVLHSGMALLDPHGGRRDPEFAAKVAERGRAWFDIAAWHMHGSFEAFRRQVDGPLTEQRARTKPEAPVWFNETAVNLDEAGERSQAQTLAQKLLYAWAKGAIGFSWYNLRSGKRIPVPGGDVNWGLMTEDWYPRAAYAAYTTITGLLGDAESLGELPTRDGRHCVSFRTPRGRVLAAWDEARHAEGDPLVVALGGGAARLVDLWGAPSALAEVGGQVVWPVGESPTYLVVDGGEPALAAPLLRSTSPAVAWPGERFALTAAVRNPDAHAHRIELTWMLPAALGGGDARATVELDAGGEGVARATADVPAEPGIAPGGELPIAIAWRLDGTPWSGEVPVRARLGLVAGQAFAGAPTIALADRAHVVNRNENVPQRERLTWHGASDLSARAWLRRDGADLALRVDVEDDVHAAGAAAERSWEHDGVQLGIAAPGQDGWWELGLALGADGAAQRWCWRRPAGAADPVAAMRATASRDGTTTRYELRVPLAALHLDAATLAHGVGFDLLVNDDDGDGRKGWIELAPGLGEGKDAARFPTVRVP